MSPIDFSITFGNNPDLPGAPANLMQDEVSVTLTHSFLKVLSRHLSRIIEVIEREIGPIKIQEKNNPTEEQMASLGQILRDAKFVE
jgi:hypothetical protein